MIGCWRVVCWWCVGGVVWGWCGVVWGWCCCNGSKRILDIILNKLDYKTMEYLTNNDNYIDLKL